MQNLTSFDYGMWPAALMSIGLVLVFALGFLRPRHRAEWRSMGLFSAWLAALFAEMYGFPLTIYALTALLGRAYPVVDPFSHKNGHLLVALAGGSETVWMAVMVVTTILFWGGVIVMEKGWRLIHRAQGVLVTGGIYSRVRHPQYLGLFMIIVALLIQWPTIVSMLMAPVLFWAYVRLARREEQEMEVLFDQEYRVYKAHVPAFIPHLDAWQTPQSETLPDSSEGQLP